MSDSDEVPKAIGYLRKHGPTARSELPVSSFSENVRRAVGILSVTGGGGSTTSIAGGLTDVAYLIDEHDFEQVLRTWIDFNAEEVDEIGATPIRYKLRGSVSKKHRDIVSDTLDELGFPIDRSDRGGDHSIPFECPFCGDTVPDLSSHLTSCPQNGS